MAIFRPKPSSPFADVFYKDGPLPTYAKKFQAETER